MVLPEESVVEGSAGQSSLVSGSIDQQKPTDVDVTANGIIHFFNCFNLLFKF